MSTVEYTGQNLKVKLRENVTNPEFYYNLNCTHPIFFLCSYRKI